MNDTKAEVVQGELPRAVGFWGATAVMVGIMIGSGIFRTPPEIARQVGEPWVVMGVWVVGGLVSLAGAMTYAELASMYPRSGGVYVFLREGYGRAGPCLAFVFGWTYMLISKPLAAAGIAIVLGENINVALGTLGERVNAVLGTPWDPKVVTSGVLVVLTFVNVRGVKLGTGVAGVLTSLKVLALASIVVLTVWGLMSGRVEGSWGEGSAVGSAGAGMVGWGWVLPVMTAVLWTYDGWSDVGAIAGEIKDPGKKLARAYIAGTVGVMGLYLLVNWAYMTIVPLGEMAALESVAPAVAGALLGSGGAAAVALVIVVSTLGSTHGSIMTGGRVSFAQSRDGLLFSWLGRVHPRFETPAAALWAQLGLSLTALWAVGDFGSLAGGFVFTMWIFYGLGGAALFVLRARRPGEVRPFRCPGYPVVPGVFVLSALVMTVLGVMESPRENMVWLGVLAAGAPAYWVWRRAVGGSAVGR
ncbi:MAG: amino acid permease [Phycisphaeraceae bacterium]|nr:MAG: amino acid permease [Phycisphaeraceae bacterium]